MFRKYIALILIPLVLIGAGAIGQPAKLDDDLWSYLQRRGGVIFKEIQGKKTIVDPGEWKEPLDRAFDRVLKASGNNSMPFEKTDKKEGEDKYILRMRYAIFKDETFNAAALPNGQMVISTGALVILEEGARFYMEAAGDTGRKNGLAFYRERICAPLIAHELAHYFNRHMYFAFKEYLNKEDIDAKFTMEKLTYTTDQEFSADRTAAQWLAGVRDYGSGCLADYLNCLNRLAQKERKTEEDAYKKGDRQAAENTQDKELAEIKDIKSCSIFRYSQNHYLASHPTPRQRLAGVDSNARELHAMIARLEVAFDDIQFSRNLDAAIAVLDSAIKKYPDRIDLRKARAVAYHKRWLSSATQEELQLKSIISLPVFREDMVFTGKIPDDGNTRGIREDPPGNVQYWVDAKNAYENPYSDKPGDEMLVNASRDSEFLSYYSTLLCYGTEKYLDEPEKKSLEIAETARNNWPSVTTYSNFALVKYVTCQADEYETIHILSGVVAEIKISEAKLREYRDVIAGCLVQDKSFVYDDITPALNIALLYAIKYESENDDGNEVSKEQEKERAELKAKMKKTAANYLGKYDNASTWAKHLSGKSKVPIVLKGAVQYPSVRGLKVGLTMKQAREAWKEKPSKVEQGTHYEHWNYETLGVLVYISKGMVYEIQLLSGRSPKVDNKYGVGSRRAVIESSLGKATGETGQSVCYGEALNIKIIYDKDDIAQEIYIGKAEMK